MYEGYIIHIIFHYLYDDRNTTEIFHIIILHTHFILHLYLIRFLLYYISLIIKKYRFEKNRVRKIKKETEEETVIRCFTKKIQETSCLLKRNVSCFGEGSTVQSANLVQGLSQRMVISPSRNWEPGLVCVVVLVQPFET